MSKLSGDNLKKELKELIKFVMIPGQDNEPIESFLDGFVSIFKKHFNHAIDSISDEDLIDDKLNLTDADIDYNNDTLKVFEMGIECYKQTLKDKLNG